MDHIRSASELVPFTRDELLEKPIFSVDDIDNLNVIEQTLGNRESSSRVYEEPPIRLCVKERAGWYFFPYLTMVVVMLVILYFWKFKSLTHLKEVINKSR